MEKNSKKSHGEIRKENELRRAIINKELMERDEELHQVLGKKEHIQKDL